MLFRMWCSGSLSRSLFRKWTESTSNGEHGVATGDKITKLHEQQKYFRYNDQSSDSCVSLFVIRLPSERKIDSVSMINCDCVKTYPVTEGQLRQFLPRRLRVGFDPQRLGVVGEDFRQEDAQLAALGGQGPAHSTIVVFGTRRHDSRRAQLQIRIENMSWNVNQTCHTQTARIILSFSYDSIRGIAELELRAEPAILKLHGGGRVSGSMTEDESGEALNRFDSIWEIMLNGSASAAKLHVSEFLRKISSHSPLMGREWSGRPRGAWTGSVIVWWASFNDERF